MNKAIFLSISFLLLFTLPAAAKDKQKNRNELVSGETISGEVDVISSGSACRTYMVRITPEDFSLHLVLDNSPADLDIYLNYGKEILDYNLVEVFSVTDYFCEEIYLNRLSSVPLQDGTYYIDIVYQHPYPPVVDGKQLSAVPFSLSTDVVPAGIEKRLVPGRPASSELLPEEEMVKTFAVDVPSGASALRVDIFNTICDIDLLIGYEKDILTRDNADFSADSFLGRETFIITADSYKPLKAGTYYISVMDQVANGHSAGFSILATLSENCPEVLKKIPVVLIPERGIDNAVKAVVEVIADSGKGSGTLVSPDGLILTGWHVVENNQKKLSSNIYVGLNLSPYYPTEELFKAEVVEYDIEKDLVLLKIKSGLYDQPIPYGYSFPYLKIGDPGELVPGQPVSFLGYPGIGGTGSRASISLTRGVICGFEMMPYGLIFKTDGLINSGSSGGAAINAYYELIGIPLSVIGEDSGQMAYIHSVGMIPDSWMRIIRQSE